MTDLRKKIPIIKRVRLLVYRNSIIYRHYPLTMAGTIADILDLETLSAPAILSAAWRSSKKFKDTMFAKYYEGSKIIALVNVKNPHYELALASEARMCQKHLDERVHRFDVDKRNIHFNINGTDVRQVSHAIKQLTDLRTELQRRK